MEDENIQAINITSLLKHWKTVYAKKYHFARHHLDACPTCTTMYQLLKLLETKRERANRILETQLLEAKEKHLTEAEDRYRRFALDRHRVITKPITNLSVVKECKITFLICKIRHSTPPQQNSLKTMYPQMMRIIMK